MAFTRQNLEDKIKEIYGIDQITPCMNKQITTFIRENGYTYLEIGRALYYFYVVKKGDISKANGGIGIVKYVMDESKAYFKELAATMNEQAVEANKAKNKEQTIIKCKVQKKKNKKRLIDLESIKEDEDD